MEYAMKRSASAQWKGSLENGNGTLSSDSGVLSTTPYSFNTRFKDEKGTNPEELVGAAHAGCFSMALSMILGQHDFTPERIDTKATVQLDEVEGGFAITKVHLHCRASVPGASADQFAEAAEAAKANCPVSKLLTAEISMDAALEG
jgi:osmotically inducible protein OsmC